MIDDEFLFDEDDEAELTAEEFASMDVSDVKPDIFTSKDRKKVTLVGVSGTDWNLLKVYLWVSSIKEKMEAEMLVMPEPPEAQ